jgi:CRISPR-associated endonuclease/helicase Cas3
MPKTDGETKQRRIELVYRLLERYPNGLTEQEIADMLNFGRRAVNNYLRELETKGQVYKDGRKWFVLPYQVGRLRPLDLSPEEAMTLYLATRLLVKQHDKRNESAETALGKLAEALTGDLNVGREIYQAALELAQRPGDVGYSRVFRTMMQGYLYRRKVAVTYRPLKGEPFETLFCPYLLEPSAIGYATYAIGHSSVVDALRTYKLQRVQAAALTREDYSVPPDFPGLAYLRSAWSIIAGEELIPVKLRFSAVVTERVRESRWHPSQEIEDDPDHPGGCIWTAKIADLTDFVPWVRSWGADVEVLGPEALRERLMLEVRRLARIYDVADFKADPQLDRLLRCWGKTARGDDAVFHPALFHMLDVGHVARALLADPASPRWRRMLARALDVDAATLVGWLPYFIATHDIGKLTAAFQSQNDVQFTQLKAEGFSFGSWRADLTFHHTIFGQAHVQHEQALPLPDKWVDLWQNMVGGHHGVFGSRQTIKIAQARLEEYEAPMWKDLRVLADRLLRQYLLTGPMPESTPPNLASATIALTGFAILCDWLGSDEKVFQPAAEFDLPTYLDVSANRARRAVSAAGFFQTTRSMTRPAFGDLFSDKQPPRPIQAAVDAIPQAALDGPALVIIEAPTGEGKTEAALAIAHRLAQTSGTDALYYALPTTATSNQMFKRVRKHLDARLRLPGDVQLIHGQAHLQEDDMEAAPLRNEKDADTGDMVAWFTSKKRAILAPFGVGTVDQAELAALNVKHVALRLVGLAGKVVIFDEVHAYDTYMTTIVARLLEWLAALDTSVIILSATLPKTQRATLARAYGANLPADNAPTEAYPSLWVLPRDGEPHPITPGAHQPDRPLDIRYLHLADDAPEAKAHWLLDQVRDGGCACWITNTVARAQDVYDILRHTPAAQGVDLSLLHARFPLEERGKREEQLVAKYGPPPDDGCPDPRPARGIVVGTQVLEQSLDLDFDVMVSDLAPIDLLLQRAGRLHRHARQRPPAHAGRPALWINAPRQDDGGLNLGTDVAIYAEYFLRQTWNILQSYRDGTLRLPHDYRPLVEAVYSPPTLATQDDLTAAWNKLLQKQSDAVKEADERLIPEPAAGKAFWRRMARLTFEEDETGAAWVVAQTRLGRESVNLIPLEKLDDTAARLCPGDETVALDRAAAPAMQRRLLRRHLRVSRPEIVKATKHQDDLPTLFTRSPRLKGYYPLWLENGQASFAKSSGKGNLVVTLDRDLGLVIAAQSEPKDY